MSDAFIELEFWVWEKVFTTPPRGYSCQSGLSILKLTLAICPGQLSPHLSATAAFSLPYVALCRN